MGYNLTENLFGYTLVQDILVESATTSVTFSGLNYTSADDLLLVSDIANNSGVGMSYNVYVNGNTTDSNYYFQQLYADSTTVGASRGTAPYIGGIQTGEKSFTFTKIKMTNSGYFVYQNSQNRKYGSTLINGDMNGTSTFTISSITSLTVSGASANTISSGSRFRLYKLNATKVADITVSTATTSVDITGLNITKDNEYMLVSDVVNGSASVSDYYLFANSNYTQSNYYEQYLYALNTSIGSGRVNDAVFCSNNGNSKLFVSTNIKLTNNGNFVYQNNESRDYGGSSITLLNRNNTSTFTTTSVNSLRISSSVTNAIGVGSRFQLYRMKG